MFVPDPINELGTDCLDWPDHRANHSAPEGEPHSRHVAGRGPGRKRSPAQAQAAGSEAGTSQLNSPHFQVPSSPVISGHTLGSRTPDCCYSKCSPQTLEILKNAELWAPPSSAPDPTSRGS